MKVDIKCNDLKFSFEGSADDLSSLGERVSHAITVAVEQAVGIYTEDEEEEEEDEVVPKGKAQRGRASK